MEAWSPEEAVGQRRFLSAQKCVPSCLGSNMDAPAQHSSDHSLEQPVSSRSMVNSRAQKESVLQLPGGWPELVKVQIQFFHKPPVPLMPINGFAFMNRRTAYITFTKATERKYFWEETYQYFKNMHIRSLQALHNTPNLLPLAGFWVPQRNVIVDMKEKGEVKKFSLV